MNYLLKILLSALAVVFLSKILSGVYVDNYTTAIWVAVIIGILFSILKPILVVLTIPITIVTFGFFLLVINSGLILIASNWIDGFLVDGFWWALIFSILLSFLESVIHNLLEK